MMAKTEKNQYPAYAVKSDDGENENTEHWNQDNLLMDQLPYKVTPLRKQIQRKSWKTGTVPGWLRF